MGNTYEEIRNYLDDIPVIDCHEHTRGHCFSPEYREPIFSLTQGYLQSDLISAGATEKEMEILNNQEIETDKKWKIFEPLWKKIENTAYARVTKIIMEKFYGEKEMSLGALKRIAEKLLNLKEEKVYYGILEKAKIKCRLVNILYGHTEVVTEIKKFIDGKFSLPSTDRILIPLIMFHLPVREKTAVENISQIAGWEVNSLEKFLHACYHIFQKMKEKGAVGMKDQSAYERIIRFEDAPTSEAEKLFNRILSNPRNILGFPEAKPLDDFLFHRFLEMAGELKLPVQLHTGHLAGIRNEITKANAIHLTPLLERYKNVRFDLFHGNWPYKGELLFLAKNYPNVSINLCWVHIIDPLYSHQLLSQSLLTVPACKIHGFGGDYGDTPEYSVAHLEIARNTIASVLSELIEKSWMDMEKAKQIARDILFNNPNQFFNLKFPPV